MPRPYAYRATRYATPRHCATKAKAKAKATTSALPALVAVVLPCAALALWLAAVLVVLRYAVLPHLLALAQ